MGPGNELSALRVTVRRGGADGEVRRQQPNVLGGDVGWWRLPLSFGLLPTDAHDTSPVWIEVAACAARDAACTAESAPATVAVQATTVPAQAPARNPARPPMRARRPARAHALDTEREWQP